LKFESTEAWGFDHALRGMRNPKESWIRSDSVSCSLNDDCNNCKFSDRNCGNIDFIIGDNDMKLAQQLIRAGGEHRKFMRQIFVSVDITAPLYWYKEFDTYKIGTVANSTSTMHKLSSTQITSDCFEMSANTKNDNYFLNHINHLESLRNAYVETKDMDIWESLIQELPSSWLQTRTITMNYENLYSMIRHRKTHKLKEWRISFINWIKTLPYADELLFIE